MQILGRDVTTDKGSFTIAGTVKNNVNNISAIRITVKRAGSPYSQTILPLTYVGNIANFTHTGTIDAELVNYSITVESQIGSSFTLERSITNVVAGDVFVVSGQSNGEARSFSGSANANASPFIRTFSGNQISGSAVLSTSSWFEGNGDTWNSAASVGQWGLKLAKLLMDDLQVPIAIFNGGHAGKPISHFARPLDYQTSLNSNYGRLFFRLNTTGLRPFVKAILWAQGESDGRNGLATAAYKNNFTQLNNNWKEDFPNIQHTYIFQTKNGCNTNPHLIKEAQRQIAIENSSISIMQTDAIQQFSDNCHFPFANGYEKFASRILPLLKRDIYGQNPTGVIDIPEITCAYLQSSTQLVVSTNTGNLYAGNGFANFQLSSSTGANITNIDVSGNNIIFTLSQHPGTATISYLGSKSPIDPDNRYVTNSAGLELVCFYQYPVALSPPEPIITSTTSAERCGSGSIILQATANYNGIIHWFATPSSETPLGSGNSFTTPSLTNTTTYYVSSLCSGDYSHPKVAVTATIKPLPSIVSTTPSSSCGGNVLLKATTDNGQVRWYEAPNGGTTLAIGNDFTTRILNKSTTYYAEAINNGCASATRTPVTATIYTLPEAPITGGNRATCAKSATTLVAIATSAENTTIEWYDAASGGNVVSNPSLSAIGSVTYYAASKSVNNCISQYRTPIKLTIAADADCFEDGGYVACNAPTTYFHQSVNMKGLFDWHEHGNAVEVKPGAVVNFSNGFSYTFGNHATCFTNNGLWLASSEAMHYFKGIGDNLISGSTAPKFYQANFSNVVNKMYIHNQQGIEIRTLLNFENGITATLRSKHDLGAIKFLEQANYSGQMNTQRYVDGYVSKSGIAPFTFPVGHKGNYRPLKIENGSDNTRTISTAWIEGDPNTINSTKDGLIHQTNKYDTNDLKVVSTIGQWDWIVNRGNATGTVVSVVLPENISSFAEAPRLRLVGWKGSQWVNLSANNGAIDGWLSGTMVANISAIGIGKACDKIRIIQQPIASSYCKNAPAQPISISTNESNLSYQWYLYTSLENQVPIEIVGATNATFTPPTNIAGIFYYQVKVYSENTCETFSEKIKLTINDLPTITTTKAGEGCVGSSIKLAAISNLGTIKWYETPTNQVPLASGNTFETPPLNATKSFYAEAIHNECISAERTLIVATVNDPLPSITSITPAQRCGKGSVSLQATGNNNAVVHWYASPSSVSPLATGSSYSTAPLEANTTFYVSALNSCGFSTPRTAVIATINPLPNLASTSNAPICAGQDLEVSVTPTAGSIYSWSGPNNFTNSNSTWNLSKATTRASGIYTLSVNLNGCTASTTIVNVVNTAPEVNATSPVAVCAGSPLQLNVNITNGANHSWMGPNGFNSVAKNPTVSELATVAMAGTYSLVVGLGSCTVNAQVLITINPNPELVINNLNTSGNGYFDITDPNITAGNTLPVGTILTYFTNPICTDVLATPNAITSSGTYYIKATSLAGCIDIEPIVVNLCGSISNLISPIDDYSSGTQIKTANSKISAANKITGAAKVTYRSAQAIELTPGFFAASGTVFLAENRACN
ncbi:Ig-like domain-containing protein [Lacihabitans lacunae]|uniref:Sialate O-acetylesterase n=1 Tax=Lacihabitans lacunae TaxID=1028214 RepID=A0ABV7Z4R3_9BACT